MIQDGAGSADWAHTLTTDEKGTAGCFAAFALIPIGLLALSIFRGWTFVSVIAAVICVFALGFTVATVIEARRWRPFELHFPEWPLTLGSTALVEIGRTSKRNIEDKEISFSINVQCEESATYRVGTDTRTDTDTVVDLDIPVKGHLRSNVFSARFPLTIPLDAGGPTLNLHNNQMTWTLSFDIDDLSTIGFGQDFALEVITTLDPLLTQEVTNPQDAR